MIESYWITYGIAALIGGGASALIQIGSRDQTRMADLIAALVTGCFFGTLTLFMGSRVLWIEALLALIWIAWARLRTGRPRARNSG